MDLSGNLRYGIDPVDWINKDIKKREILIENDLFGKFWPGAFRMQMVEDFKVEVLPAWLEYEAENDAALLMFHENGNPGGMMDDKAAVIPIDQVFELLKTMIRNKQISIKEILERVKDE